MPQSLLGSAGDLTAEVVRIAGQHMSESEILNSVTRWIKEDKASFLVRALENQDTSLGEVWSASNVIGTSGWRRANFRFTPRPGCGSR